MKVLNRDLVEQQIGYRPFTTFYKDFSIAEEFGEDAIIETYDRAFEEWKTNYKYITEFVMMLNWKIFEHYEKNDNLAELYDELWKRADLWCCENLKGEELNYFYRTTD